MLLHAAGTHQVHATGVTTSRSQAELASRRVAVAALTDRIEVRLADYRDLRGERFDAISSIGMFEHVGKKRLTEYLERLYELLRPGGRLLNHGISRPGPGPRMSRSFIQRYVFPDGELQRIGDVTTAMEDVGFEVRDVESLREHYAKTLRAWVRRLDERWEDAVRLVGDARARTWRLYMSGSAAAFTRGRISVHQILAVRPDEHGRSHFPTTRAAWSAGRTVDGDTRTPLDLTPAAFG